MVSKLKFSFALILYVSVFTLLLPLLPLRLLVRSVNDSNYRKRIRERLGLNHLKIKSNGIWVHAVSVGEVNASETIIKALQKKYPQKKIILTTSTPTGSERVKEIFGNSVEHVYAPYDWPPFVWIFLRKIRPGVVLIIETEVWPVTILLCRWLRIPVLLANARLSEKSANGYKKISWLAAPVFNAIYIAAQYKSDASRFLEVGAAHERLSIIGNAKFDMELLPETVEKARLLKENYFSDVGPVWIAASTHEGEEEIAIDVHNDLVAVYPDALLILVPRHRERFDKVANLVQEKKASLTRFSENNKKLNDNGTNVFLLDTIGQLFSYLGVADVAFVGGSLIHRGGHNVIEPLIWGVPTLSGPSYFNFSTIVDDAIDSGLLSIVKDKNELKESVIGLLNNNEESSFILKEKIAEYINDNAGATQKQLNLIDELLSDF